MENTIDKLTTLPSAWVWTTLEEVCEKITDGTHHSPSKEQQKLSGKYKYITAKHIKIDGVIFKDMTYLDEEIHREIYNRCNPEIGDILYIKDGVTTGIATVNGLQEEFSLLSSVALLKLRTELLNPYFLKWYLNSSFGYQRMISNMGGSAIKRLTLKKIKASDCPVAPLNEQIRIVTAIESLQQRSAKARALLTEVKPLIKNLRQSILQSAFSGRFTADWRAKNPDVEPADRLLERIRNERRQRWEMDQLASFESRGKQPSKNWKDKYKEPEPVDDSELPELPEGWCWAAVGDLCECVVPNRDKPKSFTGDVPWITMPDMSENSIRLFFREESIGLTKEEIEAYNARVIPAGAVIMSCVGRFGIVAVTEKDIVINQQLHAFLVPHGVSEEYLSYALKNQTKYMESIATSTTVSYLNKTNCNSVPIALAPTEEQIQISQVLRKSHDSITNLVELTVSQLGKLEDLEQSIFSKAFRGELVPQDPSDEPASELIARIRETEKVGKPKKEKKSSKTKAKKKSC